MANAYRCGTGIWWRYVEENLTEDEIRRLPTSFRKGAKGPVLARAYFYMLEGEARGIPFGDLIEDLIGDVGEELCENLPRDADAYVKALKGRTGVPHTRARLDIIAKLEARHHAQDDRKVESVRQVLLPIAAPAVPLQITAAVPVKPRPRTKTIVEEEEDEQMPKVDQAEVERPALFALPPVATPVRAPKVEGVAVSQAPPSLFESKKSADRENVEANLPPNIGEAFVAMTKVLIAIQSDVSALKAELKQVKDDVARKDPSPMQYTFTKPSPQDPWQEALAALNLFGQYSKANELPS
jgi:hypothetical protein